MQSIERQSNLNLVAFFKEAFEDPDNFVKHTTVSERRKMIQNGLITRKAHWFSVTPYGLEILEAVKKEPRK